MKTTILGILLLLLGVGYFTAPYFVPNLWEVNKWYEIALIVSGVGFIVAPDKMIGVMFGWLQRFITPKK